MTTTFIIVIVLALLAFSIFAYKFLLVEKPSELPVIPNPLVYKTDWMVVSYIYTQGDDVEFRGRVKGWSYDRNCIVTTVPMNTSQIEVGVSYKYMYKFEDDQTEDVVIID